MAIAGGLAVESANDNHEDGIDNEEDMEDNVAEDLSRDRKLCLKSKYFCLAVAQGALGIVLLICGLVGVLAYRRFDVVPNYTGGLAAGPLTLLLALTSACIYLILSKADNYRQRMTLVWRMVVFLSLVLAVLLPFACILGGVFAVVGWLSYDSYDEPKVIANVTISCLILVACVFALIAAIPSYCMFCFCAKVFGRTVGPVTGSHAGRHSSVVAAQTNTNIVNNNTFINQSQTIGANNASDAHARSLQEQNQLLQQQIALQQRIIQQQQDRGGTHPFAPAEPPPPYSPPRPGHREPSSPPPSYADSNTY